VTESWPANNGTYVAVLASSLMHPPLRVLRKPSFLPPGLWLALIARTIRHPGSVRLSVGLLQCAACRSEGSNFSRTGLHP
jgi:hypothetical protein